MNCFNLFLLLDVLLVAKSQWDLRKLRNITNDYQPLINNPKISIFKNKYDLFNHIYHIYQLIDRNFFVNSKK